MPQMDHFSTLLARIETAMRRNYFILFDERFFPAEEVATVVAPFRIIRDLLLGGNMTPARARDLADRYLDHFHHHPDAQDDATPFHAWVCCPVTGEPVTTRTVAIRSANGVMRPLHDAVMEVY